jgi:hypothetical protein
MKRLMTALAGVAALAFAAPANASVQLNFGGTIGVPNNNDFKSQLNGLGLTGIASTGASLILNSDAIITFQLLGTESVFSDKFVTISAPNLSYTEHTTFQNDFNSPITIGSAYFSAGSLAGLLNFSAVGGVPATVGQAGFGIFVPTGTLSGQSLDTFYIAYDDQPPTPDRDYDDMIIRAVVHAVPEPGTWAMMLMGFAGIGLAVRRQPRKTLIPQVA